MDGLKAHIRAKGDNFCSTQLISIDKLRYNVTEQSKRRATIITLLMYSVKGKKKTYTGVEEGFSWTKDSPLNLLPNGFFGQHRLPSRQDELLSR